MNPQFFAAWVTAASADTRVVLLNGPRHSGKTTLARGRSEDGRPFLTFDDPTLDAAQPGPAGFVRGLDHAVIDQVQRDFLDSGLLASLRGLTVAEVATDRAPISALSETFVLAEALWLACAEDKLFASFYFHDKKRNEVDFVIKNSDSSLVGLEVKAAAEFADGANLRRRETFRRWLRALRSRLDRAFGDRLFAAPNSSFWAWGYTDLGPPPTSLEFLGRWQRGGRRPSAMRPHQYRNAGGDDQRGAACRRGDRWPSRRGSARRPS